KEQEDKKKLEEALAMAESANKAKSVFLNNMSHDIRTPMNAILGFAEIAKKEKDDKNKLDEYLGKIIMSGKDLLNLINDILDMSSIESGKVKFNHVATSIKGMVEGVKDMFVNEAEKKNITFNVKYEDVVNDYIYCDEVRAKQVGINIVSNAFKYTPVGGTVSLTVRQYPLQKDGFAKYEIVVQDNGIGMSKEFKEQIFDSFSRERSATLSGIQGTGLGMAIVKKIIDMVDGEIDVWSEVNVGTRITVRLTIKTAEKEEEYKQEQPEESYNFEGKKVLLVEDNELNREIAEAILNEVGIRVESVVNGQEAVDRMAMAKPGEFDLVLMDIQMPVMDGYTATTKIRELDDAAVAYVPIVAMTANAFDEDRKETMNMGMNGHISKPIDIDEMLSTMKKCMGL
ncbi:MAG: response regulator, partial [Lachnospiraceae bacterium]|nr:response regulator [Lachnospiraceae bacterium]